MRSAITAIGDNPRLENVAVASVADDLARVAAVVDACDTGSAPVPGLRRLVTAVTDDPDDLAVSARRISAVARFAREELARVEHAVAYLTDPELEIPPDELRLAVLRDEAMAMSRDVLGLAAEDRAGAYAAVEREFRRVYADTYRDAHDRFHRMGGREAVQSVRESPSYRALAALAAMGAVGVPDDQVKVDRALASAAPPPCTRRLDVELMWKPRCSCGFFLGQQPPDVDATALAGMVERGVQQHLAELGRPEHRSRLEQAAEDLAGLGRDEMAGDLRRLLATVADPPAADPLAVAHLASGPLATVVRDVLGGGRLVVQRDLATLREDLIGRRYPKRRVLELLAEWVDPEGDLPAGGHVEVIDSSDRASRRPAPATPGSPPAQRSPSSMSATPSSPVPSPPSAPPTPSGWRRGGPAAATRRRGSRLSCSPTASCSPPPRPPGPTPPRWPTSLTSIAGSVRRASSEIRSPRRSRSLR